jgi:hypothetical protein
MRLRKELATAMIGRDRNRIGNWLITRAGAALVRLVVEVR